ncbi:hypothetical protein MSG28_000919 [Choristoneura fumiferana]|uniref:Uncharacterized protein n=1 Tax=Choristoneura fumiferana TaxID=7141 RepID=A0ACC0K2X1_CHOFU|nr:hypothetical protein MSG28_000919 [Choristoneura fumiferana]
MDIAGSGRSGLQPSGPLTVDSVNRPPGKSAACVRRRSKTHVLHVTPPSTDTAVAICQTRPAPNDISIFPAKDHFNRNMGIISPNEVDVAETGALDDVVCDVTRLQPSGPLTVDSVNRPPGKSAACVRRRSKTHVLHVTPPSTDTAVAICQTRPAPNDISIFPAKDHFNRNIMPLRRLMQGQRNDILSAKGILEMDWTALTPCQRECIIAMLEIFIAKIVNCSKRREILKASALHFTQPFPPLDEEIRKRLGIPTTGPYTKDNMPPFYYEDEELKNDLKNIITKHYPPEPWNVPTPILSTPNTLSSSFISIITSETTLPTPEPVKTPDPTLSEVMFVVVSNTVDKAIYSRVDDLALRYDTAYVEVMKAVEEAMEIPVEVIKTDIAELFFGAYNIYKKPPPRPCKCHPQFGYNRFPKDRFGIYLPREEQFGNESVTAPPAMAEEEPAEEPAGAAAGAAASVKSGASSVSRSSKKVVVNDVRRTRRTRVYDCNYDKGESYYRPVLDRLDGKSPSVAVDHPDRERIRNDVENRIKSALDDIEAPRDELFDSRGARAPRGRPLSSALEEDDLSEDITESLKRLRAGKKQSRFAEDIDFENSVSNLENRMRISDKILETVGIGQSEVSGARRALQENEERTEKRIARRLNEENSLTKWSVLKGEEESAASQRAKASRARLTDLEDEMSEMTERSAAREKRAARLRALVADSDASESTLQASKITIRAEREKKQVTF